MNQKTFSARLAAAFLCFATVLTMLPAFCLTGSAAAGDLVAYVADENENAYAERYSEYLSASASKNTTWSGYAWRGDEVLSRIDILTRSTAYAGATLTAGDFVSADGARIDKSNISFTYIDSVMVTEKKQSLFDIITRDTVRDLKAQTMYCAWVGICVPQDAKAGVYTGKLSIVSGGSAVAEFTYTLTVYDFVQPELESYVDLWMWPYNTIRYYSGMTTEEYWGQSPAQSIHSLEEIDWETLYNTHLDPTYFPALESELALYAKAGGDTVFAQVNECNRTNGDPYPSLVKWYRHTDGSMSYDYTDFDTWVEMNFKYGIDKQIKCYSMGNFNNDMTYFDESQGKVRHVSDKTGAPIWKRMWGAFLDDFIGHLEEKGWFDITYIALDERDYTITKGVIDEVKLHKNAKGETLKVATAVATFDCEPLFDDIYDLSLAYGLSCGHLVDVVADRNAKGLITTIYTCGPQGSSMDNNAGQSAESIHVTYKEGTTGFLRWALQKYNVDPFAESLNYNQTLCAGDCYLIYPSSDDSMIAQTTPRYEKLCEGLRDIEKARYLEKNLTYMKNEVHDAFLRTRDQADFRAVIRTYSDVLSSGDVPRFAFDQDALSVSTGEKGTLDLSSDALYLVDQLTEKTYIDDSNMSFSNGWTFEGQYFWLFLYSTNHYTGSANNADISYEFDFYGDSFQIYGSRGGDYGICEVFVDGNSIGEMDLYAPTGENGVYKTQFESEKMTLGNHHVKVTGTGRRNSKAWSSRMQVDYAVASVSVPVKWTSADERIATVAQDGTVTGVSTGKTVITATCGDYTAQTTVTVKADAKALGDKIAEYAAIDLSGYDDTVRTAFTAALDTARALQQNSAATRDQIEQGYDALLAAYNELVDTVVLSERPKTTAFAVGDVLDCTGAVMTVTYKNGTKQTVAVSETEVSGYDPMTAGIQRLTVTCYGKTVNLAVAVVEKIDLSAQFADTVDGAWYTNAVRYAISNGLFNGMSPTTFAPDTPMNRAMLVTVLYRMEGSPSVTGAANVFTDVKQNDYFYAPVLWAASKGIVNGITADTYAPGSGLTREQMATILFRYANEKGYDTSARADLSKYTDANRIGSFATDALSWANATGLISGITETELAPQSGATRAQVATILMRFAIAMQ